MKRNANIAKSSTQALRITHAEKNTGVKVCPGLLERIIELANLVRDGQLPDLRFTDFRGDRNTPSVPYIPLAEFLPDGVRLELLKVMTDQREWEMTPEEWIALTDLPGYPTAQQALHYCQAAALTDRYAMIRGSVAALKEIVDGNRTIPVTTFLKRGTDGKGAYAGDPISDALIEAEWDYIKRCPICKRFFYAQRGNQDACPPAIRGMVSACGRALRSRRKRASDKEKRDRKKKHKK